VRATGGEEVKSLGDGLMVVFLHSAGDAVECAVALQRGIDRLNLENPLLAIALHVGIALGEATYSADDDDWFGPAVNTRPACAPSRGRSRSSPRRCSRRWWASRRRCETPPSTTSSSASRRLLGAGL
jgi:hypothetical protein